jgi:Zn-dependent protease
MRPFILAADLSVHPLLVVYYAAAALIALVVHEYAHAFTATRLGDQSPRAMGRLTLNPKPHLDTFGSLVFPAILLIRVLFAGGGVMFAYAKPMPLNAWNSARANRDVVLIQAAGPVANVALAFVFGGLLVVGCGIPGLEDFLGVALLVNVLFAAIHVVPMPPLDGARAITPFLPPRAREVFLNLEQYGALFILLVFFIIGGPFFDFVGAIVDGILALIPGASCSL